jgi:hypothetical protein
MKAMKVTFFANFSLDFAFSKIMRNSFQDSASKSTIVKLRILPKLNITHLSGVSYMVLFILRSKTKPSLRH